MGLSIFIVFVAFSTFLFSYFYLRLESPVWPRMEVAAPGLSSALLGSLAVLVGGAAMRVARNGARAGSRALLLCGACGAAALASLAIAVQVRDLAGLSFNATTHAYGSIFFTLSGFVLAVAAVGVLISGVIIYGAVKDQFTPSDHIAVTVAERYKVAMIAVWWIGTITLYAVPRLT